MQLAVLGGSALFSGGGLLKLGLFGASLAASVIMNGRKKPVGKLNDTRVSSSSYGRGIAIVEGTMRVTGNMFWATDFREEKVYITQKGKEKTGGKGKKKAKKGKAQPVYKYYANFAMGLCEGPVDEVLRIWADNNLIYNKMNPDDEDLVGPGFSTRDEESSGKGSQKSAGGKKGNRGNSGRFAFRFYGGDDQQMPDPFMEKEEGVGRVPAYRDLCYLMFTDFALEDFGNRIPTITAEVSVNSEPRSMVLKFERVEYPGYEIPQAPASSQLLAPFIFDIARESIYASAYDVDGRPIVRRFDTSTRRELKPMRVTDNGPQTVPHGDNGIDVPIAMQGERTWTDEAIAGLELMSVTPSGDLVYRSFQGNYSPIVFVDPSSGRLIKSWGASGNILPNIWNGIFVPAGAFPAVTQSELGEPESVTIVYETFGKMHVFDNDYNKVAQVFTAGRRANHAVGVFGTDQAIFFTNVSGSYSNGYAEVYKSPLERINSVSDTGGANYEKLVGKWPREEDTHIRDQINQSMGMLNIAHFTYMVGPTCLAMIVGPLLGPMYAVKMDPISGEVLWQQELEGIGSVPSGGFAAPPQYNNTNYINFTSGNNTQVKIDFKLQTVHIDRPYAVGDLPPIGQPYYNTDSASFGGAYYWSERDAWISWIEEDGWRLPVISYMDRKLQTKVDLAHICRKIAERVGIPADQIDTGDLATQEEVNGFIVEQPTDARSVLDELANTFMFDACESDYTLRFSMRGKASVRTITEEYLGVVEADFGSENEKLIETFQQQLELPERVTVAYYDPKNDYETGSEYTKRPGQPIPVMTTREHLEITVNMALIQNSAKSMSSRILYSAWAERHRAQFKLPRDFMILDPSDVVTLQMDDGRLLDMRLTDISTGANMELEVSAVAQFAPTYSYVPPSAEAPKGLVTQPAKGSNWAKPLIFNIPYIRDGDNDPNTSLGFYWGAAANKPGFNFGMLQSRYQDGDWQTDGVTQLDAIWGYVNGPAVPEPANGWNIIDTETRIKLTPGFDFNADETLYVWESLTDDEWPSEKNMILIGDELILFKDVEEDANGQVTISTLVRGYRGTINAAYSHRPSDKWALVLGGSIHYGDDSIDYLNERQQFLINSGALFIGLTGNLVTALEGSTLKPLPAGDIRRTNNPGGSVTFTWSRATRLGGSLKSGTGTIPLNEESERYYVFLLDEPFNAATWNPDDATQYVWKSAELSTSQVTISSVDLASAGLTNTMDIHIVIHQMSAVVGYGYPSGATMPYTVIV